MALSALSGMRVLDLSVGIAGAFAAKLFACYGADVVKVERPAGDPARGWGPFLPDRPDLEGSVPFLDANAGKRGIRLDLGDPRGRAVAVDLIRRSDLVVESFAPGTLARLGLGAELFADTVLLSVSNFGQDGPYRDVPASEIVLYAMGHEMYGTGAPDREPLSVAPLLNLYFAGLSAAVAALGAVLGRRRHGTGEHVDVSIMETLLASIDRRADSLVAYAYCGEPMRRERAAASLVPGYSPCRDGHVAVSVSPAQWPRLVAALGHPDVPGPLPTEPAAAQAFRRVWRSWCAQRDRAGVTEVLQRHGIPCAPVNSLADVDADPHLADRGFFVDLDRDGTVLRHAGPAIRLAGTPGGIPRPAPRLGEHTDEVLGELGYPAADVAALRTAGIV